MGDILIVNKDDLKNLQSKLNPLIHLINIDKDQDGKNQLVKDLIGLAMSLIDISKEEVLRDTFYHPSKQTFTYTILFNKSLNSYPISKKAIRHLNAQWEEWTVGLRRKDVRQWKGFSEKEQSLVREIWSLAVQNPKEKDPIGVLFDANHRDMQAKQELKEAIVTCLNSYCEHATDKSIYHVEVQKWQKCFDEEFIQSIQMPEILRTLKPFALNLNPCRNVQTWRTFLKQRTTISSN